METITRYDVVSSHLLRKTSMELFINSNSLGVYSYCLGMIAAEHIRSLPDDLVVEIRSRLPVKSLMQFKSVCKHWLFLIKQDTHLIDLHSSRSKSFPNLLCINPMPEKGLFGTSFLPTFDRSKTFQQSITCADITEGSSTGDKEEQVQAIISASAIAGSTDKIPFERRRSENSVRYSCLYSYDRKSKTCNKIEMDGDSSFTLVTTFTESLFPVQPLDKAKVTSYRARL
ncbi:hypothetical protein MKX03_002212 [Papaver bracteatum]|nr:hypothetical protein MKX03_002212 [Papaver bracteatum]